MLEFGTLGGGLFGVENRNHQVQVGGMGGGAREYFELRGLYIFMYRKLGNRLYQKKRNVSICTVHEISQIKMFESNL